MSTTLYQAMIETEAAYNADVMSIDKMQIADAARTEYYNTLAAAREAWSAVVHVNKDSAIDNAYDTEGTEVDELYWFEVAQRSLEV